ncbi:MAG: peptidylprolyl isomerase [Gammaproteobacteria bacterium]|nr:peptidylprolyl isomerase [Gammaproteobacteria bacterium]
MNPQQDPQTISPQTVVTFTYVILDQGGGVLEQSDLPMSYIHGVDGKMYPKVETAMTGAAVGDEVEVELSPAEGFGDPDPELMYVEALENVPPEYRHIGAEAMFQNEEGETITMKVTKIENGELTLDANHPFAGMTVKFKITVLGIRHASPQEIGTGEVMDMQGPITLQ